MKLPNALGSAVAALGLNYGDGLRAEDPAGIVHNGGKLRSYINVNSGIVQNFKVAGILDGLSIRFDVVNLFDKSYLIRDGSGVGVGAPQYGARRGFFAGISKRF